MEPTPVTRLESSLRRMVSERLRLFAGFSAVWAAAHLVIVSLLAAPSLAMTAAVVGFAAACGLAIVIGRTTTWSTSRLTAVGVVLGLMLVGLLAGSLQLTGEPAFFWVMPMVLVGAGVLVTHRWWYVVFLVTGASIVMLWGRVPGNTLSTDLLLMASSLATGMLAHEAGRRMVFRLEALREAAEQQRGAVEEALAAAQRELEDRERAEAEGARLREQLVHAQKMEAIGTLAGGFAHDMNNVLGGILGLAELVRETAPEDLHADLDDIIGSIQRGCELTRNLLGFARRGQYRKEAVATGALIQDLVRLLARTVPKGVVFATDIEDPIPVVEGDPSLLAQALLNLCLNSVDAMRGVGQLAIHASRVDVDLTRAAQLDVRPGPFVSMRVVDTGSGMSPETVQRIFEPFFTTKPHGRGTGLGLAMVYGMVRSHGGAVEVDSELGRGTTIELLLPESTRHVPASRSSSPSLPAAGSGTVLLVDDDDLVRRLARRILEAIGYRTLEARDGQEALAVYAKHPDIRLVVLDMSMPVMGGADCFRALRASDPAARVLLVSGYTMERDARRCLAEGALGFVDKPYTVETLANAVARALRTPTPRPTAISSDRLEAPRGRSTHSA